MRDENELWICWFFLMSAIYLSPHIDKWIAVLFGSIFCALGVILWGLQIYKAWRKS